MGKGDQQSRRCKVTAGSFGKRRPRKSKSIKSIPVKVLNDEEKKDSKVKVRKEVGYPTGKSENAEVHSDTKQKAETKAKKTKKTEE
mgnify:CR=1 FL=1